MRLSPAAQYNIVFWLITGPLTILAVLAWLVAGLNPFWFRKAMMRRLVNAIDTLTVWRANLKIIKYFYNKMNMFETLKGQF